MTERIRLLVVDDHPVFRRGLLAILADAPDIEVVDAVGTGGQAIEAAQLLAPDIILLDLNLPDTNGIDVTKKLVASRFPGQVLVLTMYAEEAALVSAMEAGARGYLLKGATQEQIVAGIRSVAGGGLVFGAQVSARVTARISATDTRRLLTLTAREEEVLTLIADGRTNAEIARRLVLSDNTVRNHITNLFSKLGVTDRQSAASLAHDAGVGRQGGSLPWMDPAAPVRNRPQGAPAHPSIG
jgi:DNA-binding NarL/FixJ family response regulator